MNQSSNTIMSARVSSLKKIDSLCVDFEQAVFTYYPAMKLGVDTAVNFYIDKLLVLAKRAMLKRPAVKDWVITAPAYNTAPAAANLLCWKLFAALQKSLPEMYTVSLVDLRLDRELMEINDEKDFKRYYEYSNNSVEDRIRERRKLHSKADDICRHRESFSGRGVIVINDIKVTGTQQEFMSQSFSKVAPACLDWLYIMNVDQELGKVNPGIEHQINNSSIQTLNEFKAVLRSSETQYTARCISRLFTYDMDDFQLLLESLDPEKQQNILDYAIGEGRFEGAYFIEKLNVLKAFCEQPTVKQLTNRGAINAKN
ncbi:MAG: phosphoribosyltransferase family protein [Arenicella sp.]